MTYKPGSKGVAVIFVALSLVFLIALIGFVLNVSYAYYVSHQLQVAADAAALAGISKINDSDDSTQFLARQEAQKFSEKNYASGKPVKLDCDFDTSLSNSNDITVGHWSGSNYQPGITPVNALQARPRKTDDSPNSSLPLLFRVAGWDAMDITTEAIAALSTHANAPIAFCTNACSLSEDTLMYWSPFPDELGPEGEAQQGIAWTLFDEESQAMDQEELAGFFCGKELDACGLSVYSNNGVDKKMARQFQCAFVNPEYDKENKTIVSGNVTSWSITVPTFNDCPPGAQGQNSEPYDIVGYARVTLKEVYSTNPSIKPYCACEEAAAVLGASPPVSPSSAPNAILISDIECITCWGVLSSGSKPKLVR